MAKMEERQLRDALVDADYPVTKQALLDDARRNGPTTWLLHRDDQIGRLLFWPIDHVERRRTHARMSASRSQLR
jgi:hypothetical protein